MRTLSLLYDRLVMLLQWSWARGAALRLSRQHGQGLVEYGLILVLIMVVCVGILTLTGKTISEVWYNKLITPAFGP